ncbi:MAG: DUF134 domain-containing protein [Angelakisella sp.]
MARPVKPRRICQMPQTAEFVPNTQNSSLLVELAVDEYEAIRLIDLLGFTQEDCALQMNVARTTVQAIYDTARRKLADAVVNGKRLIITGGNYDVCVNASKCCGKDCHKRSCREQCCQNGQLHCKNCQMQL